MKGVGGICMKKERKFKIRFYLVSRCTDSMVLQLIFLKGCYGIWLLKEFDLKAWSVCMSSLSSNRTFETLDCLILWYNSPWFSVSCLYFPLTQGDLQSHEARCRMKAMIFQKQLYLQLGMLIGCRASVSLIWIVCPVWMVRRKEGIKPLSVVDILFFVLNCGVMTHDVIGLMCSSQWVCILLNEACSSSCERTPDSVGISHVERLFERIACI